MRAETIYKNILNYTHTEDEILCFAHVFSPTPEKNEVGEKEPYKNPYKNIHSYKDSYNVPNKLNINLN
jgi:hypothetical protein